MDVNTGPWELTFQDANTACHVRAGARFVAGRDSGTARDDNVSGSPVIQWPHGSTRDQTWCV
jgi:hypothetical protein